MSSHQTKSSRVTEILELTSQNKDDHSQVSNEEYLLDQGQSHPLEDDCHNQMQDALEEAMEDNAHLLTLIHLESSLDESSVDEQCAPVRSQSLHTSSSAPTSQSRNSYAQGAENQVSRLLAQPNNETKSAITRLEDVFIKSELKNTSMKDIMKDLTGALMPNNDSKSLLTKDEQVEQAQVAAKLKKCQLEAAELDVQKTKRSMDLELAIAKGQFISQLMKDNNIAYEQAKLIADDLYKTVEQRYLLMTYLYSYVLLFWTDLFFGYSGLINDCKIYSKS
ncbi:hypothetical protein DFH28DRAFT_900996 [Melampsora americana]|nr:hypothetical protein DFH28DRAFT_900996 [Melampsora americana]